MAPDEIEVIASATFAPRPCDATLTLRPDVVLMVPAMPNFDGVQTARRIVARALQTRRGADLMCGAAARARGDRCGGEGYLLKGGTTEDVVGRSPPPRAARRWIAKLQRRCCHADPTRALGERERQALPLGCWGAGRAGDRQAVAITETTVSAHLSRIYLRIGVHYRTEAALRATTVVCGRLGSVPSAKARGDRRA